MEKVNVFEFVGRAALELCEGHLASLLNGEIHATDRDIPVRQQWDAMVRAFHERQEPMLLKRVPEMKSISENIMLLRGTPYDIARFVTGVNNRIELARRRISGK